MSPVHLCLFDVEALSVSGAELTPPEQERGARFMREEDRRRYFLGRTVIRRLCGDWLGCAPTLVELRETERGKPFVAAEMPEGQRLEFNLAHSGRYVALAWDTGHAVGVDIEKQDRGRPRPLLELARVAFSPKEQEVLVAAAESVRTETFFRIWARKEAIVKAEGCGIAGALQRFSVVLPGDGAFAWADEVLFPESGTQWQLFDPTAPEGYALAVAATPGRELQVLTPRELRWTESEV